MERRLPDRNESALRILDGDHLSEDALEVYSLGRMTSEAQLEEFEEHLLVCGYCHSRLEKMDAFTEAAVSGARAVAAQPENKKPRNLAIIAIAASAAAMFLVPSALLKMDSTESVDLVAVRNDAKSSVPPGRKLSLRLDTTGLTEIVYRWELSSASGEIQAKGDINPGDRVSLAGLESGQYWVRLKSHLSGDVVREFSLSVR